MKPFAWIAAFLLPLAFSCTDDDYPVTLETAQVQRLLTNDSSKVWVPVSGFSDCAMDDAHKFTRSRQKDKLGEYWLHPGTILCEGDKEVKGTWEIIQEGGKNQLKIHTPGTTTYQIELITASKLRLLENGQETRAFIAVP